VSFIGVLIQILTDHALVWLGLLLVKLLRLHSLLNSLLRHWLLVSWLVVSLVLLAVAEHLLRRRKRLVGWELVHALVLLLNLIMLLWSLLLFFLPE